MGFQTIFKTTVFCAGVFATLLLPINGTSEPKTDSAKKPLITVKSRPMGDGDVLTGLDVLERDSFKLIKNKKLGLLTNNSAIDKNGRHILDCLYGKPDVKLVTLF